MKAIENLLVVGVLVISAAASPHPGTVDETFDAKLTDVGGPPGWPGIVDIALASDGKIYIGGHAFSANGVHQRGLARLNPDGSLDSSFRAQPSLEIGIDAHRIFVQPDGKIWAGWLNLYHYLETGEFDSKVNGLTGGLAVVGTQLDGAVLVGEGPLRRYTRDGTLDETFHAPANQHVPNDTSAVVQADGKIIIVADDKIVRLHADGVLDTSFTPVAGAAEDMAIDPRSGKIYFHGVFTPANGIQRQGLARLNPDGTIDSSFAPPPDLKLESVGAPPQIALQPDGKLIVGSNFNTSEGGGRLVRLNLDGSLDAVLAFDPGVSQGWPIYQILVQPDGKILVCGDFTMVNGLPRVGIVRLNVGDSAPALLCSVPRVSNNNQIDFQVNGPTNQIIVIEATSDLVSPQWTAISTNRLEGGEVIFQESRAGFRPKQFYRARF